MNQEQTMTFGELKKIVENLEKQQVEDQTKVFIDTGWDSLQEISSTCFQITTGRPFQIQDELTKEYFGGFVREEKKETKETIGESEKILVIEHLY